MMSKNKQITHAMDRSVKKPMEALVSEYNLTEIEALNALAESWPIAQPYIDLDWLLPAKAAGDLDFIDVIEQSDAVSSEVKSLMNDLNLRFISGREANELGLGGTNDLIEMCQPGETPFDVVRRWGLHSLKKLEHSVAMLHLEDSVEEEKLALRIEGREDSLAAAREFVAHGFPVFIAKGNPNYDMTAASSPEFFRPSLWQESTVDAALLDTWESMDAVCVLAGSEGDRPGVYLTIVDVDPKNGASVEAELDRMEWWGVDVLAIEETPSGGIHAYTYSSGFPSRKSHSLGIDFLGCKKGTSDPGTNVFTAPTKRPKYEGIGYHWIEKMNWQRYEVLTAAHVEANDKTLRAYLDKAGFGDETSGTPMELLSTSIHVDEDRVPAWLRALLDDLGTRNTEGEPRWLLHDGAEVPRYQRIKYLISKCQRAGFSPEETFTLLVPWTAGVEKFNTTVALKREVEVCLGLMNAENTDAHNEVPIHAEVPKMEWAEPIPFERGPLPALPLDVLPPVMANMILGVATAAQSPVEIPFMAALTAISAATRGVWDVDVHSGWRREISVLWGLNLSDPAERKTRSVNPFFKELENQQRILVDRVKEENLTREVQFEIAKQAYAKAIKDCNAQTAQDRRRDMQDFEPLPMPIFIQSNTNAQAAAAQMASNGGNLIIKMTEASTFANLAGLHNNGRADLGSFNDWYDGNWSAESRITGDRDTGKRPTLTLAAAVQPEVMRGFAQGIIEGSGFISRLILLNPPTMVGQRNLRADSIPLSVEQDWDAAIRVLFQRAQGRYACMTAVKDPQEPFCLTFAEDAREVLLDHLQAQEYAKRSDEQLKRLGSWIERQGGRTARMAALFTLFDDPHADVVPLRWLEAALTLDPVLIDHADASLSVMRGMAVNGGKPIPQRIINAIDKIVSGQIKRLSAESVDGILTISKRDVYEAVRRQTTWVKTAESLDLWLTELADHNYLRFGESSGNHQPLILNPKVWS